MANKQGHLTCDIIIPTYQNSVLLSRSVSSLFLQAIPNGWQVRLIVTDDGSTDQTLSVAKELQAPHSWGSTVVVTGSHVGAAGARNRGFNKAEASIVIFLGGDILLRPGALAAHLNFHQQYNEKKYAALGAIKWDPRLRPSPLMEWMMHGGTQNNFDAILGQQLVDPRHYFYGSFISLKRSMLNENPFPVQYQSYGWEDLDLGRHLAHQGLKLIFLPNAIGLHHHYYSAKNIYHRQLSIGQNLVIYQQRYPKIVLLPRLTSFNRVKHRILRLLGIIKLLSFFIHKTSIKWSTPQLFQLILAAKLKQGISSVIISSSQ